VRAERRQAGPHHRGKAAGDIRPAKIKPTVPLYRRMTEEDPQAVDLGVAAFGGKFSAVAGAVGED
jgi:hypothetical protein